MYIIYLKSKSSKYLKLLFYTFKARDLCHLFISLSRLAQTCCKTFSLYLPFLPSKRSKTIFTSLIHTYLLHYILLNIRRNLEKKIGLGTQNFVIKCRWFHHGHYKVQHCTPVDSFNGAPGWIRIPRLRVQFTTSARTSSDADLGNLHGGSPDNLIPN